MLVIIENGGVIVEYSKNYIAIPPGETIREQLEERKLSQKEFAVRMGLSEKHVSQLINGKVALTSSVAIRLEDVLGVPANFWLKLESSYRENLERVKEERAEEADKQISAKMPYAEMARHGWIKATRNANEKVANLRKFFEVARLIYIDNLNIPGIAYRALGDTDKSRYAQAAWAQKARLDARNRRVAPINIDKLVKKIEDLRALTILEPSAFCAKLVSILADCGICIEFLPHLKSSFLHGATFIDSEHIVIGLTVRGKYADKFWFSLFHEIGHIVLGHISGRDADIEEQEKQADIFAQNVLLPSNAYQNFLAIGDYSRQSILHFAKEQGIAAGIVLGRLQKENYVDFSKFNELKQRYEIV